MAYLSIACSQYSIIPARYAYVLKTDIDDNKACLLERELMQLFVLS